MAKRKTSKPRTFEGFPVIDATRGITLHITPADIKGASKKNPASCAAARAGQRELGKDVRVFLSRTYVKHKDHWVRYRTPESASREIVSFDRGASFEPGDYHIPPPSEAERLGHYRGKSTHPEKGTYTVRPMHATGLVRERSKYDVMTKNKGKA